LRAEAARGNLAVSRIGKKHYTTLAAIEKMVEKCLVQPKVRTCILGGASAAKTSGPSETEGMKQARAQLEASVALLRKPLAPTSLRSTGRTSAKVIRPKFSSPISSAFTPRSEPR
jgi:hypothetical protein